MDPSLSVPARAHAAFVSIVAGAPSHAAAHGLRRIDAHTVATVAGNAVCLIDIQEPYASRVLLCEDGGGVGGVAFTSESGASPESSSDLTQAQPEAGAPAPGEAATTGYLAVAGRVPMSHTHPVSPARPHIYIYAYPSLRPSRTLAGGADVAFADVCFSPDGALAVSIAAFPDYTLAVWDWKAGRVLLRTKAFSQDVCVCRALGDGRVITSGTGHIRFWRVASTFTGMKLQGELGKFGKVDLSDIADFACLPDGKVVSTSESGFLLLWEGILIKCMAGRFVLKRDTRASGTAPVSEPPDGAAEASAHVVSGHNAPAHAAASAPQSARSTASSAADSDGKGATHRHGVTGRRGSRDAGDGQVDAPVWETHDVRPAHEGGVAVVQLERDLGALLTAGADGWLRWWDVRAVDILDHSEEMPVPGLFPAGEAYLGRGVRPTAVIRVSTEEREAAAGGHELMLPTRPQSGASHATSAATARAHRAIVWLVQDANGTLLRVRVDVVTSTSQRRHGTVVTSRFGAADVQPVHRGHAGRVSGVVALAGPQPATSTAIVTAGHDGTLRVWQPGGAWASAATAVFQHDDAADAHAAPHNVSVTWLSAMPLSLDSSQSRVAAGFADGVLRVFQRAADLPAETTRTPGWRLIACCKPHTRAIERGEFHASGALLATCAADGTLFLFRCKATDAALDMLPIGFWRPRASVLASLTGTPCRPLAVAWSSRASTLYVGCDDGVLRVLSVDDGTSAPSHTFELSLVPREYAIRAQVRRRKPKDEQPEAAGRAGAKGASRRGSALTRPKDVADAGGVDALPAAGTKTDEDDGVHGSDAASAVASPETVVAEAVLSSVRCICALPQLPGDDTSADTVLVGVDGEVSHVVFELTVPMVPRSRVIPGSALSASVAAANAEGHPVFLAEPVAQYQLAEARLADGALAQIAPNFIRVVQVSPDVLLLCIGTTDGVLHVRDAVHRAAGMRLQLHDARSPLTSCTVSYIVGPGDRRDATLAVSGGDGALSVSRLVDPSALMTQLLNVPAAAAERYTRVQPVDLTALPLPGERPAAAPASAAGSPPASTDPGSNVAFLPYLDDHARLFNEPARVVEASAALPDPAQVPDVTRPDAYSIEQEKQRAEADARAAEALDQKNRVRKAVARLKEQFAAFRARADAAARQHASLALTPAELSLDPALEQLIQDEGKQRLDELEKEAAYALASRHALLRKLVERFLPDVDEDVYHVTSLLDTASFVSTLRTQALSSALLAAVVDDAAQRRPSVHVERLGGPAQPQVLLESVAAGPPAAAAPGQPLREMSRVGSLLPHVTFSHANTSMQVQLATMESMLGHAGESSGGHAATAFLRASVSLRAADATAPVAEPSLAAASTASPPVVASFEPEPESKKMDDEDAGEHSTGSAASFEQRRQLRLQRKAAMEALQTRRPGPQDEHPPDVEAVAYARSHMGDYSLKLSKDYRPPEGVKLDAVTKRRQMLLLELHLHTVRMQFNQRVKALADVRRLIGKAIAAVKSEVATIDTELSAGSVAKTLASAGTPPPVLPPNAETAAAEQVFQALGDISESSASESLAQLAARVLQRSVAVQRLGPADVRDPARSALHDVFSPWLDLSTAPDAQRLVFQGPRGLPLFSDVALQSDGSTVPLPLSGAPSGEETGDALFRYSLLLERKSWLMRQVYALVSSFDATIERYAHERVRVQHDCVSAAVRMLALRQELDLLRDMAKRDAQLDARLSKSRADKATVSNALAGYAASLAEKRAELDALQAREKVLLAELEELVGASHPAFSALLKIFKRKIRRRKPQGAAAAQKDEEDSESEDSDMDDIDGVDEDDDDEEDVCPENVDRALFDRVLTLRDRRLDIDDAVVDVNKAADEIRRAADRHTQREKTIDKELAGITAESAAFQKEKQSRLNTITSVVVMSASQILVGFQPSSFRVTLPPETMASTGIGSAHAWGITASAATGALPPSIEQAAVFTRAGLRSLRLRIGELGDEISSLETSYRNLHKDESVLASDKRKLETAISSARSSAEELQMLKFGRIIDVDALDRATAASNAAALKVSRMTTTVAETQDAEIADCKQRILADQAALLELTRLHTHLLEEIASLSAREVALEAQLSGRPERAADATALAVALGALPAAHKPALARSGDAVPKTTLSATALTRSLASTLRGAAGRKPAAARKPHSGMLVADAAGIARRDAEERTALVDQVQQQAQEIEALRAEIAMLRRKGGLVYVAPAAPLEPPV